MLGAAQQQMADFVRDRPAEQRRDMDVDVLSGDGANGKQVDRHQDAAALLAIEHRFAKRDDALARRAGVAVDQPQHEVASGEQRLGAGGACVCRRARGNRSIRARYRRV